VPLTKSLERADTLSSISSFASRRTHGLKDQNKSAKNVSIGTIIKEQHQLQNTTKRPKMGTIKGKIHDFFYPPTVLEPRSVYFNYAALPSEAIDPKSKRPIAVYSKNSIRTTKYTPLSFIPKNLFYQFKNVANVYFLFLIILGAFQIFGVQSPGLAAVPLIVILIITGVKDAFEDSRRTISDLELNNNPIYMLSGMQNVNVDESNRSFKQKFDEFNSSLFVKVVRSITNVFKKKGDRVEQMSEPRQSLETLDTMNSGFRPSLDLSTTNDIPMDLQKRVSRPVYQQPQQSTLKFKRHSWKDIKVGDVVHLRNNEEAPADLIILSSSEHDSKCFVETKNLDGETNLKPRQGLTHTSSIRRTRDLSGFSFQVKSEAPNLDMYNYNGSLNWEDEDGSQEEPINIENLILRGSTLKNTKWVIGLVLFTGHESKIMLNSGVTPSKRSRISRELNLSVFINFMFLFILCLISGIVNGVFYDDPNTSFRYFEYSAYGSTPAINGVISFFVAMIIYQALVPISLYISVEIVKTFQAFFIYSDVEMYHEALDYPCTPKSWNISDDLGQIEYIFSDKTGTLTQNVMEFKRATVGGKSYGLAYTEAQAGMDKRRGIDTVAAAEKWDTVINQDKEDMCNALSNFPHNDQFDPEKLTFISSEFVKDLQKDDGQGKAIQKFMIYLSLCHTVLTEPCLEDPSKLKFKAESPDEAALVQAASDVGYTFLKRTRNGGIVRIHGEEISFDILQVLEFSSTRKRMSVICKISDKIMIITKGADSVIYSRLDRNSNSTQLLEETASYLEEYASEGLRTLCIAGREISPDEYESWKSEYNSAAASIENRSEKIEEASSKIETNLILVGATAIEDKLQVGVPESIENLGRAGIKLWVLTGDKIETAINIGFSCNLLSNDMELLIIRPDEKNDTKVEVDAQLTEYLSKFSMEGSEEELKHAMADHSIPTADASVIIDGVALASVFEDDSLKRKFLLLCKQCKAVLCCRVSPAQKAQVVSLVRDSLNVMTLAIGDGANDVAMIQTANVGVGIVGEEGRQAAMSSDYAIGQFRFLTRLVLVHGRWDYKRLSETIPVFFYKNVVFTLTLFWYGIYNNFDGSYLMEYTLIMFYNLAFTSLPIIFLGIFDQDVEADVAVKVPQLYKTGILREEWNQWKFIWYMIDGLYQSVVSFFFPILIFTSGSIATYNGLNIDQRFWIGNFVITISVVAVNVYTVLRQYRWDWLTLLIDSISVLLVFFWIGVYSASTYSAGFYRSGSQVFGSLTFWVCLLPSVIACLLPRFVWNTIKVFYFPRDIDIIRECVARGDFHEKAKDIVDEEKEISNDSSIDVNVRHSLERVVTARDLPELSTAHSLVQTFTMASSVKH
jgi:phospholipid-translocating ATPase